MDPHRHDWQKIIADIEAAGISLYKLSVMMRRQYIQIQRIKEGGRVLHHEGEMLLEIHRSLVSCETLRSVPSQSHIGMQTS